MKADESVVPPHGTLFEAYAPVERYARVLEAMGGDPSAPPGRIGAEDILDVVFSSFCIGK